MNNLPDTEHYNADYKLVHLMPKTPQVYQEAYLMRTPIPFVAVAIMLDY